MTTSIFGPCPFSRSKNIDLKKNHLTWKKNRLGFFLDFEKKSTSKNIILIKECWPITVYSSHMHLLLKLVSSTDYSNCLIIFYFQHYHVSDLGLRTPPPTSHINVQAPASVHQHHGLVATTHFMISSCGLQLIA